MVINHLFYLPKIHGNEVLLKNKAFKLMFYILTVSILLFDVIFLY